MRWHDHIVSTPDTLHGAPRFRGTRIPVSIVLDNLAAGAILRNAGHDPALAREEQLAGTDDEVSVWHGSFPRRFVSTKRMYGR